MHPEYVQALPDWRRVRDCLGGEPAVKARAEEYLPRLDSQTDQEYRSYLHRANFYGGTARVLEDSLAAVFRRSPEITLAGPEGSEEGLKMFVEDCDLAGRGLVDYAKWVLGEVLSVGRAGSLVAWDGEAGRPWVSGWRAEDILDWRFERRQGRLILVRVVLQAEDERLCLWLHRGRCISERWQGERLLERRLVKRDGEALGLVPFVFHGPRDCGGKVERSPLADVVAANLDHYRLSADYRQGLHLAALPTAWVAGFDKSSPLRVGASEAWVSELPGATAGFLEFRGAGLEHVEKALAESERQIRELGDRLLGKSEAGPAREAGLAASVSALENSLARVLALAGGWITGQWSPVLHQSRIKFASVQAAPIKGADLSAVVEAWRCGAISRESLLECLRRGDLLPDGRGVKEEKALLYRTGVKTL